MPHKGDPFEERVAVRPGGYEFWIYNPKLGECIRVVFNKGYALRSYIGHVHNTSGRKVGDCYVYLGSAPWVQIHDPEVEVRREGYGLCMYLAAALLAGKINRSGVEACTGHLTEESWNLWNLMWWRKLAKCKRPPYEIEPQVGDDEGEDNHGYFAPCFLHAKDVKKLLAKYPCPQAAKRRR